MKRILRINCLIILGAVAPLMAQNTLQPAAGFDAAAALARYKAVELKPDISTLSEADKEGLKLLIGVAGMADDLFWLQAWGDKNSLLGRIDDAALKAYIELNYGPWDRLNNDAPFVAGIGSKPIGANFYPPTMTQSEFDALADSLKNSPYSILQRNAFGAIEVIPYSRAYSRQLMLMTQQMRMAAHLFSSSYPSFATYLNLRANDLLSNNYDQSDRFWLEMKDNRFDLIVGPIENYEDKLFGLKTAFEAYVLIRDFEWSRKLEKYTALLPWLQENLPVSAAYKSEKAGSSGSQLAVFDAVYYAGDCNAGSKTIAVNLPNDEIIQQEVGTRRTQIRNVMQAKFTHMVEPIADVLIDPKQRKHITFNAFFSNVMFHEVAHGLGIKQTISGKGTVRDALGANYSAIEECKADVLGLYMVTRLLERGELTEGELADYYVTFVASVFRSVRFGASSAHGKANMITFNYLLEHKAVTRNKNGTYRVNLKAMQKAINGLAGVLLKVQGDGEAQAATDLLQKRGLIKSTLAADLQKVEKAGIPVDIYFKQGLETLNIKQ
jgi:hypothetical protein